MRQTAARRAIHPPTKTPRCDPGTFALREHPKRCVFGLARRGEGPSSPSHSEETEETACGTFQHRVFDVQAPTRFIYKLALSSMLTSQAAGCNSHSSDVMSVRCEARAAGKMG
jgi:hypothetical protein